MGPKRVSRPPLPIGIVDVLAIHIIFSKRNYPWNFKKIEKILKIGQKFLSLNASFDLLYRLAWTILSNFLTQTPLGLRKKKSIQNLHVQKAFLDLFYRLVWSIGLVDF